MAAKINPPAGGQKLIVIVGPTASGKSDLGIKIAKKISARGGPASGWPMVSLFILHIQLLLSL